MSNTPPAASLIPTALTSLAAVQTWVGEATPSAAVQAQMIGLINSASTLMLNYVSRDSFLARLITEVRTGMGMPSLMLRNWPVLGDITALTIEGRAYTKQTGFGNVGWVLNDPWDGIPAGSQQLLSVVGASFPRTPAGVSISYMTGYAVQGEAHTVPNDGYVWPSAPYGRFSANWKVLDSLGALMATVAVTPAVGQYVAPTSDTTGYLFNAAQGVVQLYYSFIPADVDYACAKWVGEWLSYRKRIGKQSETMGGQLTTSYKLQDMPDDVKLVLRQYDRTVTV